MSVVSFEQRYRQLRRLIDHRLEALVTQGSAKDLSAGLRYVLGGGGKRVRSSLLMLTCDAVGGQASDALDAAVAVELLHNFTLVHDDIMDNAPSRRGQPTVHTRWNVNTALLVGDVLLGLAYKSLSKTRRASFSSIIEVFTKGFLDVCEGQAMDLEFEKRKRVSLSDYFEMIEKKTASMIAMSAELGGIIGRGTTRERTALRRFGHHLGRAFQVQDDLLDVIGKQGQFGKTIGGDILEGKKTFLLLKAVELCSGRDKALLHRVMERGPRRGRALRSREEQRSFVGSVRDIYESHGIIGAARTQIKRDTAKATAALNALPANSGSKMLRGLSEMLLQRTS